MKHLKITTLNAKAHRAPSFQKSFLSVLSVFAVKALSLNLGLAGLLLVTATAWAQDDELTLGVHRTFGYGNGSQIQGNFRLSISGPDDLQSVTFTVDGETLATDTEPPFEARFVTDSYALGWHELGATGTTAGGQTLTARPRRFEFVSGGQAFETVGRIMVPVFGILLIVMVFSLAGPILAAWRGRNQPPLPAGAPRQYGLLGGSICPKCGRPFARHWWGLNMVIGKLDRCDHCGRWSIVQAQPHDVLARAEAAELEHERARQAAGAPAISAAEQRRRALDESRYQD